MQDDSRLRANCREMSRWLEEVLRDPGLCLDVGLAERKNASKTKILSFKKGMEPDWETPDDPAVEAAWDLEEKGEGEFARMECALPVIIGMQFRKKQLSLANKHYGHAEYILDSICDKEAGHPEPEDYFRLLREGWERVP